MKKWLEELLPILAMVSLECMDVGLTTLSKAAMSNGLSHYIFVFYSNALGSIIFFPLAYFFERKKTRPPINFTLLCKFFLLGFCGITVLQNCVFTGVSYSSPTLASALSNLVPAFTFMLAIFFRMEKLDIRSSITQVKILGTVVSILGALIVTLYKGPSVFTLPQPPTLSSSNLLATTNNWILAGFFLATACFSLSVWNNFQAIVLEEYPSELTILSFYCFFGTIQCFIVALVAERNLAAWKITPNIQLVSIIYSAVCGTVISCSVLTWCIGKKGPVFVASFKPLGIAVAALLGVIFLGDTLYIGSIFGSMLIVTGFYGVIWAQSKQLANGSINKLRSATAKDPLLERYV
ncbi:hypothetical protein ACFE04_028089 [Oxalis oulophora]